MASSILVPRGAVWARTGRRALPTMTRALSTGIFPNSRIAETQAGFSKAPNKVTVKVPATSANLGPGFDAFGFAVDVWNTLEVERSDKFEMVIKGEGAGVLPCTEDNVVAKACQTALKALGQEMPPLKFICKNAIPPTRGLGSSSAALVAGLTAGMALGGRNPTDSAVNRKLLLQLAAEEEGHPDNVAPAVYGGFQVAINTGNQWITQRVPIPEGLQMVLFVPTFELPTSEARAALPDSLSYKDSIFNIGRAAMLVNCFASGQFEPLRYAMQDKLHQPYRSHMFPFETLIKCALEAGAHGAFLSGAGPTVLAVTGGKGKAGQDTMAQFLAEEVSASMSRAAEEHNLPGYVHITEASSSGVQCHTSI